MDTLFHFIFSIIVGLAIGIHRKHRISVLVMLAFLSILVDIDHFLGLSSRGTFHNVFFVFFVPLTLFLVFYVYEERKSIKFQTYSLILLVMLTGHLVSDMLRGGVVKLFYPFSSVSYSFPEYTVVATSDFFSPVVSSDGLILLVYSFILFSAVFIEDFIYHFEKKHESFKKALSGVVKDLV
ncbi:hypothetical protein GQ472_05115 [archaeon]|nr:hypothetical protein [archaeon]